MDINSYIYELIIRIKFYYNIKLKVSVWQNTVLVKSKTSAMGF